MAVKMIVLSTLALAYLLYLIYFRTKQCHESLTWSYLGLEGENEAELPHQSLAVMRTFTFAILYLTFNVLLTLAAVFSLCEFKINSNRFLSKLKLKLNYVTSKFRDIIRTAEFSGQLSLQLCFCPSRF